jgi:hypothetical protein
VSVKALLRGVLLALVCSSLSGCYCLTNLAIVGFAVGEATGIDVNQPAVAVKDIVGLSVSSTQSGYLLHLNALMEDGKTVHMVRGVATSR